MSASNYTAKHANKIDTCLFRKRRIDMAASNCVKPFDVAIGGLTECAGETLSFSKWRSLMRAVLRLTMYRRTGT
jgi:hypothetical protein